MHRQTFRHVDQTGYSSVKRSAPIKMLCVCSAFSAALNLVAQHQTLRHCATRRSKLGVQGALLCLQLSLSANWRFRNHQFGRRVV